MADRPPSPPRPPPADLEARLVAALRENLKRRKQKPPPPAANSRKTEP